MISIRKCSRMPSTNVDTVERIHILGQKCLGKVRPVIIRFLDYNEKNLFGDCNKVKGSDYSLSNDYPQPTLQ